MPPVDPFLTQTADGAAPTRHPIPCKNCGKAAAMQQGTGTSAALGAMPSAATRAARNSPRPGAATPCI